MPKVFPCYSPSNRELAREMAGFLERGAGVEVLLEEGEMRPGQDLIAKVAEGLSADVVLVLLAPDAVPDRWIRERWTQVFWDQAAEVGTAVATLLVRDCKFPDLLRRKNFFDLRADRLAAFRAIKRWLMKLWSGSRSLGANLRFAIPGFDPHNLPIAHVKNPVADRSRLRIMRDHQHSLFQLSVGAEQHFENCF